MHRDDALPLLFTNARDQAVPTEYNSWLVFRGLVDIVLMNDFFSYMLFAWAFAEVPTSLTWVDALLYLAGATLIVFNWFIKLDALRVVKDYAWCTCTADSCGCQPRCTSPSPSSECTARWARLFFGAGAHALSQIGATFFSW